MTGPSALGVAQRVAIWDAALSAARMALRMLGLFEVTTPVRLPAVAIEPWIEPVAAPPGLLATSPELPMKQLLCRGAPGIFQIAHCLRRSERGRLHAEEFHLLEWYRHGTDIAAVQHDVEHVVRAVGEAVRVVLDPLLAGLPTTWRREGMLDLVQHTIGVRLRGDEDAQALRAAVLPVRPQWTSALVDERDDDAAGDPAVRDLDVWTAFFSAWCDDDLDPWLARLEHAAVHVGEMPVALAALAEVAPSTDGTRTVGHRFESHLVVGGRSVELANGYRELLDAAEQRRRFEVVQGLRARHGLPALPMPEGFLQDLREPGLPPTVGVALGLDRLVLLAAGRTSLHDVALVPDLDLRA